MFTSLEGCFDFADDVFSLLLRKEKKEKSARVIFELKSLNFPPQANS